MNAPSKSPRGLSARGTARLKPWRKRLVTGVAAGLWASGVVWLVFHDFLRAKGEFGPEPSPLEPWWLKLHGAFAFAALFLFGLLWGVHIEKGWSLGRMRRSGALLVAGVIVLTVSGYLLYYVGSDTARALTSVIHWGLGVAAIGLYWAHRLADRGRSASPNTASRPRGTSRSR